MIKYACQNIQCAKYGVVYDYLPSGFEPADYDPELPIICTLCGYHCDIIEDPEPTPEPEAAPLDVEDLGPHIEELQSRHNISRLLLEIYMAIDQSAALHPQQVRIIMRELVHAYLLHREQHD